jgi:hypothetical protein
MGVSTLQLSLQYATVRLLAPLSTNAAPTDGMVILTPHAFPMHHAMALENIRSVTRTALRSQRPSSAQISLSSRKISSTAPETLIL